MTTPSPIEPVSQDDEAIVQLLTEWCWEIISGEKQNQQL